jgi:LssY C-terminus
MSTEPQQNVSAEQPAVAPPLPAPPARTPPAHRSRRRKLRRAIAVVLLVWLIAAYLLLPALWRRYVRRHPALADIPGITHTGNGIPGDPLNVALIGTEEEVERIMLAAGWYPADPITLRSSLKIAADTVLRRAYDDAPVSNLYLFGRKQDLAFQQPVGGDPRKRHHVRFWRSDKVDPDGRPVWVGSATYDIRVGLSHTTAQITHHIAPDVDAERDHLFADLERTGDLAEVYNEDGFHQIHSGRNGGGDPWHTDGNLRVGVIASTHQAR